MRWRPIRWRPPQRASQPRRRAGTNKVSAVATRQENFMTRVTTEQADEPRTDGAELSGPSADEAELRREAVGMTGARSKSGEVLGELLSELLIELGESLSGGRGC